MVKIYECAICKGLSSRGVKGEERFRGTREEVRKHLRETHHLKKIHNPLGKKKDDISSISKETISEEWI